MFYFLEFLEKNPSEVVIFLFEITSDVDQPVELQSFYYILLQVMGLIQMVYKHDAPNSTNPWPTLRDLTDPANNQVSLTRCSIRIDATSMK